MLHKDEFGLARGLAGELLKWSKPKDFPEAPQVFKPFFQPKETKHVLPSM